MTINLASPYLLGILTIAIFILTAIIASEPARKFFNGKKKELPASAKKGGRLPLRKVSAVHGSNWRVERRPYTTRQRVILWTTLVFMLIALLLILR